MVKILDGNRDIIVVTIKIIIGYLRYIIKDELDKIRIHIICYHVNPLLLIIVINYVIILGDKPWW